MLKTITECWWLTPIILATQANSSIRPYLKKLFIKMGLVEWPKVNALNSSLNTAK
jgi:hypothetical protein